VRGVFTTRSEAETERVASDLARSLRNVDVVYLWGDLGAGKTCFARGLAAGLGAAPREVASPTFSLLHEYAASDGTIILRHLDLYRVEDRTADLEALGVPEVTRGAPVAVEWPGKALRRILPPTIEVRIDPRQDGSRRIALEEPSP
jgi:tRNA threonylcarbamoyladenosine biosynthesis protein TsaE